MIDIAARHARGERNFARANLAWANLAGADLTGANLTRANLARANLAWANLTGADLAGANLTRANLTRADLARANLAWANLTRANLTRADLARANLTGANLAGANLTGAYLPHFQICPEVGPFVAFKKLYGDTIAEVHIPADAPRTSSLVGRKCRAGWVTVAALYDMQGNVLLGDTPGVSRHDHSTEYRVGATVIADGWDDDIRIECTHGIHFFMTLQEAREYQ